MHIRIANEVKPETQLRSVVGPVRRTLLQNHNGNYLRDSLSRKIDAPAVRVLRPGTFGDFGEWKIQKSGAAAAVGQVKVPQAVVGRVICDV
ncbi:hypothetical protein BKA83DRAFT_4178917 [Pisolithus microcarpus]|nr:hypothetical protein BKA83DRAFT_4178917 [Pisolithus microcarpus]